MIQFPQHIQDKANKMIAAGTKMSFDSICEMYMKSENKNKSSKKEAAKWAQRSAKVQTNRTAAEIMRENAENNLPSSMR